MVAVIRSDEIRVLRMTALPRIAEGRFLPLPAGWLVVPGII
jgi:hypothetical protein